MSKHDDDTCPHLVRASLLEAENARLKAEVEAQAKRWAESEDLISHYKQQMDEVINDCQCSSLKAEVERLTEKVRKIAEQVTKERKSAEEWHGRMTDDYNNPNGSAMGQDVVEASASLQAWEKAEELLKDFAAKEGKPSV